MLFQQFQQSFIQLVPIPILIGHILPSRVQNSEIAFKIPKRITNLVRGQDIEHILEPGQENIVRRFVPATALLVVSSIQGL